MAPQRKNYNPNAYGQQGLSAEGAKGQRKSNQCSKAQAAAPGA
jgi:hypothetical protein